MSLNKEEKYCQDVVVKLLNIDSGSQIVVLNEIDAEELGLFTSDRLKVTNVRNKLSTTCVVDVTKSMLKENELGAFNEVSKKLQLQNGDLVEICGVEKPKSLIYIKKKMNGLTLTESEVNAIVKDLDENKLSSIEASAFVSAVYMKGFNLDEIVFMTKSLTKNGKSISLDVEPVVDKHSIGGINGRVTMIVVPIVAAAGLYIPKTSSRSITSSAGTADAMEVLANVSLSFDDIKRITEKVGGVITWGGALDLAPVDDKIIRIEHPLSLDPEGQVIASVMAKKASVGSQFVVIDIPVGPGLKVVEMARAEDLAKKFIEVGKRLGIKVEAVVTDASKPSGKAFGPALEAKYSLEILEGKFYDNLAQKSCELAGTLFELVGIAGKGKGFDKAKNLLESGSALEKMKQIIAEQGERVSVSDKIELASYVVEIKSKKSGDISNVDSVLLTRIARIAGAPADKKAGVLLKVEEGDKVLDGTVLFEIYSSNERKLKLAQEFAQKHGVAQLEKIILAKYI